MKPVALLLALLATATSTQAQLGTVPAIDTLMTDFVTAFNAKDATKLASLYAADAVWMPAGAAMIRGRANIEAALRKAFERTGVLELDVSDSEVSGAQAFAVGTFTITISTGVAVPKRLPRGSGGDPAAASGAGTASRVFPAKFLTVFRRVGNEWKIAYDMQNADQPRPSQR